MINFEPLATLKCSIQRALVGEVPPRLEAVTCKLNGHEIQINTYFRGAVTNEDIDLVQCISTEVIADFPEGYSIEERCASTDEGEPVMLEFWAFLRKK